MSDGANNDEEIQKRIEDVKGRLADDELSEEQISQEALRVVKPYKMDFMYKTYAGFLKMWHFTERDVYHKKIMQTKKRPSAFPRKHVGGASNYLRRSAPARNNEDRPTSLLRPTAII